MSETNLLISGASGTIILPDWTTPMVKIETYEKAADKLDRFCETRLHRAGTARYRHLGISWMET
jgi:hypothetical protein